MDGAVHRIGIPRKPLSNVLQYDNVSREGVAPLFSVSEGRLHLCDLTLGWQRDREDRGSRGFARHRVKVRAHSVLLYSKAYLFHYPVHTLRDVSKTSSMAPASALYVTGLRCGPL